MNKSKHIISWALFASIASLFIILILGYFGESLRFFDVLSNFKGQIFLAALSLLLLTLFFKKPRKVQIANLAILASILVITSIEIIPWYYGLKATGASTKTFRVSLINVLKKNNHYDDVLKFVDDISPDLVVFMEIDETWLNELAPLDNKYPHKIVSSILGNDGIVIYSKLPVIKSEEITLSPKARPNFKITLDIDDRHIDCIVAHPISPTRKPGKWEDRNTHIANLATLANSATNPVIIIADLNTSMWSPFYKKMINTTKLRNSRKGFGLHGTYPAPWALISGIPIDHILLDKNISCKIFATGPHLGSDHLPIWADIVF